MPAAGRDIRETFTGGECDGAPVGDERANAVGVVARLEMRSRLIAGVTVVALLGVGVADVLSRASGADPMQIEPRRPA